MNSLSVLILTLLSSSSLLVNGQRGFGNVDCLGSHRNYFPDFNSNVIVDFTVHYRCPPGLILHGGDEIAVCQDSSSTSGPRFPVCVPPQTTTPCPVTTCDDRIDVEHAVITEPRFRNRTYAVGTIVKYRCVDEQKYCRIGLETRTCLPDGTWSQAPRCQAAMCPVSYITPHQGSGVRIQSHSREKIDSSNSYYYHGSYVQYCCEPSYSNLAGYSLVECRCDGSWSGTPPTCTPPHAPPVTQPPIFVPPPVFQPPCAPAPPCSYQQSLFGQLVGHPCQTQLTPCQQAQQARQDGYYQGK